MSNETFALLDASSARGAAAAVQVAVRGGRPCIMVNVPTLVWIDEAGRIVRPNHVAYGNNKWQEAHGFDAEAHKATAEPHFVRAGELAPQDFTIRRGSMPTRDIDPMGPEFFTMVQEWSAAGEDYYHPLPES